VLASNRMHPIEHAGLFILATIPLLLIGAPPSAFLAMYVVQRLTDWLQHSPGSRDFGWVGRWIVYSPIGYRINHSPLEAHWDTNFGDFLVIWSRLLGTSCAGDVANETLRIGTEQYTDAGSLVQLMDAAVLSFRDIGNSLRHRHWVATHVGAA
jgi:sterol desaturase/sphingolipid hydroxylase (fatty acid hydroxylase superfamily)